MFLYLKNEEVVGLIVGLINNEEIFTYDFKAPKRGRITELIIKKEYRKLGIGKELLNYMENYLKKVGCKDILIGVFAYNTNALHFYEKYGYHLRVGDMIKTSI